VFRDFACGSRLGWRAGISVLLFALPCPGNAQTVDEIDLQGRASVTIGSGARALGMGGAFLARADDATAASWNPAGLSYLRRPEISLVGASNSFETTLEGVDISSLDEFVGQAPDFLSVAFPFEVGRTTGSAQLSFQRTFASFAGDRNIERGTTSIVLSGSGGFDVLALGVGIQPSRSIRVGGTLNRWINGFSLEKERLLRRRTQQEVDFDFSGWNVNLGLIWTPVEALNIGLVGKTPFSGGVDLSRRRTDFESGVDGAPDTVTHNAFRSDDVVLDFPGAVGVGLSWRPQSALTLAADYTRTFWSEGKVYNYFVLPKQGEPTPPDEVFDVLSYPRLVGDQVDTDQLRLGLEFVLIRGRLKWPLRVGYFNDRQFFSTDSGTPRFNGFTAGTGIIVGPLLVDVAYLQESGSYTDGDVAINVSIRRLVISTIYRFSRR
jgi:hypothetical protein